MKQRTSAWVSATTKVNNPAAGAPTITGTAQAGETLTANTSSITDADGLDNVVFTYQWLADDADITGETDSSYTLTDAEAGKAIKVRVSFADDAGNEEALASAATAAVTAASGPLTGFTLLDASSQTALATLADGVAVELDAPANGNYGVRVETEPNAEIGSVGLELTGAKQVSQTANHTPYSLFGDDGASLPAGSYSLRAMAYSEKDLGGNALGTLEVSFTVTAAPDQDADGNLWSAELTVGAHGQYLGYSIFQTTGFLTKTTFSVDGVDHTVRVLALGDGKLYLGMNRELPDELALRVGQTEFGLGDATPAQSDASHLIQWPRGDLNWSEGDLVEVSLARAETTDRQDPDTGSPATGAPSISGTAQVGETLTANISGITDADGLDNVEFTYQWLADDADLEGVTGSSYTLTDAEVGETIKVKVSFTDDADNEETITSAATGAVAATVPGPPEHLRVVPHDAQGLDLSWEAPASDGGSPVTGYKVWWKQASASWDTAEDASEETVSGTARSIDGLTDGVEYAVRVIAVNAVGDGPSSAEATGTPRETIPPQLGTALVDGGTLTLTFDEALDEASVPATTTFEVTVGGAGRGVDGVDVAGNVVTLTLASAVAFGDTVTVSYTAPSDETAARIRDSAGNAGPSFSGQAAVNDTKPPLTANVLDAPQSHDGETVFTFELRFSEEPHPDFSYETLRDHAFTVTGGKITRSPRIEPPGNVRWRIHVQPAGDADVLIVLPVTTDCGDAGAVCTADGRMLSNRTELTIEGSQ